MRDELASEASRTAAQFLDMLIRALDYLPPVAPTFGDFLRAVITADMDLVPDDTWCYREALVYAFRRYGIPVDDVVSLGDSQLCWPRFEHGQLDTGALRLLARLPIVGSQAATARNRERRCKIIRRFLIANRRDLGKLGLLDPSSSSALPILIEAVHSVIRVGPSSRVLVSHVVRIVQGIRVNDGRRPHALVPGGCTLVIDEDGELRYAIKKDLTCVERTRQFFIHVRAAGIADAKPFFQRDWESMMNEMLNLKSKK